MAEEEAVQEKVAKDKVKYYEVPSKEPRYVDYDFRHPQRFSQDQLEAIQEIYSTFGRTFAASLGTQIRATIEIKVEGIRSLSYQEFISTLVSPTCVGVVNMDPWEGTSLIEVNSAIILAIIDRLLGGQGEIKEAAGRELTEIELEVAKGILGRMIENLKAAWGEIEELNLKIESIGTDPGRPQIIPPEEAVIVAALSLKIKGVKGRINHCIPSTLIDPIVARLTSKYSIDQGSKGSAETLERLQEGVGQAPLAVIAELGTAQISMGDILGLQIGDVVKLTTKVNGELVMKVGDQKKFLCRPGTAGSRMAVQVTARLNGKG